MSALAKIPHGACMFTTKARDRAGPPLAVRFASCGQKNIRRDLAPMLFLHY
jgi:hypothetical protein